MKIFAFASLPAIVLLSACSNMSDQKIVEIEIGQPENLTVYVAEDCGAAPSFADIEPSLPGSAIMRFADGGTGTGTSATCEGTVPGRIVEVTGLTAGTQKLDFQSGPITVIVKHQSRH